MCSKPLVIAERFRFFKRQQAVGESVSEYCAVLQKLSETCDFGIYLEDSLRDRLVFGIRCDQSKKRLLTEKNLTFKKAKEMALAMEMTIKDTNEQQGATGGAENVNKMRKSGDNKPCYRCSKSNHVSNDCYFKNTKCSICGKIGHIYRKCKQEKVRRKKRNQDQKSKQEKEKRKGKTKVFAMAQDSESESGVESESDSSLFYLFKVNSERSKSDAIWLRLRINDVKLKIELDTGSALLRISNRDYRRHFNSLKLKKHLLNSKRIRVKL